MRRTQKSTCAVLDIFCLSLCLHPFSAELCAKDPQRVALGTPLLKEGTQELRGGERMSWGVFSPPLTTPSAHSLPALLS